MEKTNVFTPYKKYSLIGLLLILVLTGCSGNDPINAETEGFFNHYFIYTFSVIIKSVASFLGENYGLSIIFITLIIRLALMPLMLKQMKSSFSMKGKMQEMKPELDALKESYKGKTNSEDKLKMQKEMQEIYKKHQFNPIASLGCLPLIIQFPIILGFYYAIRRTPEIADHTFLWFNLGQVDYLLPLIAAGIYFLQTRASLIGMDEKQRKQMAIMGFISPLMIGIVSFSMPAALPLYWTVSGSFLIIQTIISRKIYEKENNQQLTN